MEISDLLHHNEILNFNQEAMSYIVQTSHGTRQNKFLTDPVSAMKNIYKDLIMVALNKEPEESQEEFELRRDVILDQPLESVDKSLKKPKHLEAFQKDLITIQNNESGI